MHYLIHLPHCGTEIPENYKGDYLLSEEELHDNVMQYCDLYTDELFSSLYRSFGGVKNTYSRLFYDPERFDDESEAMHKNHALGWFYENAILEKKPLRNTDSKQEVRPYFDSHHAELNKKTAEKLEKYGRCTIIDCHSFSNERYWFHDRDMELPEICIGFEEDHVDPFLLQVIQDVFSDFETAINMPYFGSLVPTDYWGKDHRVKSVMIEINKKLYLEADHLTKNRGFKLISQKLTDLTNILLKEQTL